MYDKNFLLDLIKSYLEKEKKISAKELTDTFAVIYNQLFDYDQLTEQEQEAFNKFSDVVDRFSDFKEDFIKYPNVYTTEEDLRKNSLKLLSEVKSDPLDKLYLWKMINQLHEGKTSPELFSEKFIKIFEKEVNQKEFSEEECQDFWELDALAEEVLDDFKKNRNSQLAKGTQEQLFRKVDEILVKYNH
jgi:hypothetical protein